jgi:hypothetical protein
MKTNKTKNMDEPIVEIITCSGSDEDASEEDTGTIGSRSAMWAPMIPN